MDAACTPTDIKYPTDWALLNEAREKTEAIIHKLHNQTGRSSTKKTRTYRQKARKQYTNDPIVAIAVSLIREHPNIHVTEVARRVGIARSGLQRRFHQTLNRGILSEIQRARLTKAQSLLLTSDANLETIAEQSGFASVQRLSVCFRDAFGQSPGAYRKFGK